MQPASGFIQLASAERIGATKCIFTVMSFCRENVKSALEWG